MIWLLRDFDLLAVLLHAATLSLEALVVGGIFFLLFISDHGSSCRQLVFWSAVAMAAGETASAAVSAAMMLSGSGMGMHDLLSASFLRAQALSVALAITIAVLVRLGRSARVLLPVGLVLVASTVWLSHAVAQMDHRWLLALLTALHHLGTAAWVGAMPYLLLTLRKADGPGSEKAVRRYSVMAMIAVAVLVGAGVGMSWFYVGAVSGLYGTAYGILLLAKIYLLILMLALGGANWYLLRKASSIPTPLLLRLRSFSEVEIGLGFTVLLAAASLTSQPPAVDVTQGRATRADYVERMGPAWPRLKSPPMAALTPPTGIDQAIQDQQFNGISPSDANDMAWSEYNHHWAGLVVFFAGLLALLSRWPSLRWARFWPLTFLGLAIFIVLRADPEAWPLGPRPFWATFSSPDVLEHRFAALLISIFAVFKTGVETGVKTAVQAGNAHARWPSFVFPAMCALGAAVLLTHGHASGDVKNEVLANASHTLIALFGATAGWARWLELRLPAAGFPGVRARQVAGYIWPVALMLAAAVLVNYREV